MGSKRLEVKHLLRISLTLVCAFLVAVLAIGGLEAGLRLAGVGTSGRYLVQRKVQGEDLFEVNPEFFQHFFALPAYFMMDYFSEYAFAVPAHKEANTYRIFVFGESAAHGDPDPPNNFARQLRAMLELGFPGVNFEVYGVAFPAVTSEILRMAALECAQLEPDLFIVYMGNNEFVGPFANFEPKDKPYLTQRMIRAQILLGRLRLMQVFRSLFPNVQEAFNPFQPGEHGSDKIWAEDVYSRFRTNLEDICQAGVDTGAHVVVSSVGVNVRNWEPMQSVSRTDLTAEEYDQWHSLYQRGTELQQKADLEGALEAYASAAAIDDGYATLQYRRAQCLWQLERYAEARPLFWQALDLDAFRWRSNSRTNAIIAEVAKSKEAQGVLFADAADRLAKESPQGVPGAEWFYDYVHLSFNGHHAIASTLYDVLKAAIAERVGVSTPVMPALSLDESKKRAALSAWRLLRVASKESSRQLQQHGEGAGSIAFDRFAESPDVQFEKLCHAAEIEPPVSAFYEEALQLRPGDPFLRAEYARFLLSGSDYAHAYQQAQALHEQMPLFPIGRRLMGQALAGTKKYREALDVLNENVRLFPADLPSYLRITSVLLAMNRPEDALAAARPAVQKPPMFLDDYASGYINARIRTGPVGSAKELLRELLWQLPEITTVAFKAAPMFHFFHREFLETSGIDACIDLWQGLIQECPNLLLARMFLAESYMEKGDEAASIKAYREAVPSVGECGWALTTAITRHDDLSLVAGHSQAKGDLTAALATYRELTTLPMDWDVRGEEPALERVKELTQRLSMEDHWPPFCIEALVRLARVLHEEGDDWHAANILKAALVSHPDHVQGNILYIQALRGLQRDTEANDRINYCQEQGLSLPSEITEGEQAPAS